jgi:alkyl hydroperoxide reductase subunit D
LLSKFFDYKKLIDEKESAAIMSMLNFYYKFKHMLHKDDEYRQTGLRMTALANPVWGKQQFEMMAFAVSVLNGCETCIQAHEQVLRDSDVSVDKIHDLARLTAVVKGLQILNIT